MSKFKKKSIIEQINLSKMQYLFEKLRKYSNRGYEKTGFNIIEIDSGIAILGKIKIIAVFIAVFIAQLV